MNPLLKRILGKGVYYGRTKIDMYKFSNWLWDYNQSSQTRYTPKTATKGMIELYIAGLKKGQTLTI